MHQKTIHRIAAVLAALMLGAFAVYIATWCFDEHFEGDLSLALFLLTLGTGLFWLVERYYFLPIRVEAASQRVEAQEANAKKQPWWLDWTAGLFPVLLLVFLLRSFGFEPYKIPSGSMIPTLEVGDLILVNKYHYGLRLPVIHTKITQGEPLARGDVVVFRYPPNPSQNYIKRVVGLPGDVVAYFNKRLTINGQQMPVTDQPDYFEREWHANVQQFEEDLAGKKHRVLNRDDRPAGWSENDTDAKFLFKQNCAFSDQGVRCTVPAGHYFMMGDNRDNSLDSRYFGFVPDQNIVGKAVFIWMNFGNFKRVGLVH